MDTDIMVTHKTIQTTGKFPFDTILTWYQKNGRHDLPWRQIYSLPDRERLYKVWIAEVMLQQTQVDRVIAYYTRFLTKYPTIESLAATNYDELFPYYQGLGYYGRARRMIELAKLIVDEHDGIFPDDFEKLRKLPGIGKYTAQALLAFGYDKPVLAMDANLEKIFKRYYFGDKNIFQRQNSKGKIQNEGIVSVIPELGNASKAAGTISGIQENKLSQSESLTIVEMDSRLRRNDGKGIIFYDIVSQLEEQFLKDMKKSPPLCSLLFVVDAPRRALGTLSGRNINNALMDFGALASTTFEKIDRENYPLPECLWFKTEGSLEIKKLKTINSKLRTRHACLVFLHESHKSYWSSISSHYEPFLIEPTGTDDRRTVQDYFSTTFGLEVSVRPSFGSGVFEGTPVKLFHAQIQTGTLKQKTFSKKEKEEWMGKNIL